MPQCAHSVLSKHNNLTFSQSLSYDYQITGANTWQITELYTSQFYGIITKVSC